MTRFSLTIKDESTEATIYGESSENILGQLKEVRKLKEKSDIELGFDIKIPSFVKEKMRTLGYAEQIMVLLYYKSSPMNRSELHKRDNVLFIKDSWWNGSNFTRDLDKKISEKLLTKTNDKYKLTPSGVNFIRKNILEDKNE